MQNEKSIRISSIPRLILMIGDMQSKRFSLLNHFIAYQCQANRFVSIIENALRPVGTLSSLFNYDYMISEINQAYLRCTLTGSLKRAVSSILKTYQSDFIILEDTMLKSLSDLMGVVSSLKDMIRFDSLTTVIDSFTAEKTLEFDLERQDQIRFADILLLDKYELLNEIRIQHLLRILKELNTKAPILSIRSPSFDPSLVYGVNLMQFEEQMDTENPLDTNGYERTGICDRLYAMRYKIGQSMDKDRFYKKIEQHADSIFRIEGILTFRDERLPVHVQYVGGRYDIQNFPNPSFRDQFVVIVGKQPLDMDLRF